MQRVILLISMLFMLVSAVYANEDLRVTAGYTSSGGGIVYAPKRTSVNPATGSSSIAYDFSGMFVNIGVNFKFK